MSEPAMIMTDGIFGLFQIPIQDFVFHVFTNTNFKGHIYGCAHHTQFIFSLSVIEAINLCSALIKSLAYAYV